MYRTTCASAALARPTRTNVKTDTKSALRIAPPSSWSRQQASGAHRPDPDGTRDHTRRASSGYTACHRGWIREYTFPFVLTNPFGSRTVEDRGGVNGTEDRAVGGGRFGDPGHPAGPPR